MHFKAQNWHLLLYEFPKAEKFCYYFSGLFKSSTQCNVSFVTQRASNESHIQCLAKTWIYLTPYVCTERIFDSRPFIIYKKYFWKNSYKSMWLTSLCFFLTFCVILVNHSRRSETLNFRKNSKLTIFSFENSARYLKTGKFLRKSAWTCDWYGLK